MDRLTRFSLKNAAAIAIVALLVTAGGIWSAMQLKKETMPDVQIPIVVAVTPYPGAAPADVYDNVTEPIEKALRGVPGVKSVSATSGDSYSAVVAEFGFSEDMEKAEQNVNKALANVKLPENVLDTKVSRIGFGSAPIVKLAVIGKDPAQAEELRNAVRDDVIPALSGVEGVGEARLAADAPAAIRIELDPDALEDEGLTAASVVQQLQAANLSFPVGAVDLGTSTEPIRVSGTVSSIEDFEDFQVAVYPDQGKLMGEAFAQIGEGMGALGSAVGGLAQGMGQGFSAVGQGMGQLGQATGQIGSAVGQLGSAVGEVGKATGQVGKATGEVAMQVGLVNGIQQIQGQLVDTKLAVEQLKATASQVPSTTPEYAALQQQITQLETQAIPGMEAAIASMQKEITASQKKLQAQAAEMAKQQAAQQMPAPSAPAAPAAPASLPRGGGVSMPSRAFSMPSGGTGAMTVEPEITTVSLGDIATITYAPEEGTVGSRANGQPAALIDIVKTQDANTVDVSEAVAAELDKLKGDLPPGTRIETVYDSSRAINASIAGMMREGLLGAIFAIVVILLFLRNSRATLIAAVSIPLSVLIAMALLRFADVTLNVMTLGGLTVAIGRVVDDSIVVIENIFRHLQRGDARTPELIRAATSEVSSAITSSTLTTVAVFVPLGMVTGIIGKIFLPFALTVALSLLASLLVAVTVVPLLARLMLLRAKVPQDHSHDSRWIHAYKRSLDWALGHRAAVVATALAVFVGSLALIPLIGTGFVPETKEKYVQIEVAYPDGTKSTVVDRTVRGIEKALAAEKDVEVYESTIGGSNELSLSGSSGGPNKAMIFVKLDSGTDTEALIDRLRKATAKYEAKKGVDIVFQNVNASGTNSQLDIVVKGRDLKSIRAGASAIEKRLEGFPGLENVSSNLDESRKQLTVDVDQDKAAAYGLNAGMVAGTVRGFVAEQDAGTVKLDGRVTPVKYALALDPVDKAAELRRLELATPLGERIRLATIAKVQETASPASIYTLDGDEYAQVSGRITERDSGSVISAVRQELETVKLPAGVTYEISGAAEQMSEAFSQLGVAMVVAVGAVFLVMIIAFGEAAAPLSILFSLPLAVVGGLIGLWVAGLPLDVPAMIGALMLIGIVVTNAIVLVDRVQQKRRAGMDRHEALVEAGSTRMRPILMTAIATIMALAPLASGFAEGALISQSLAVIVIGGLTTSTMLTLIVVPVAYDLIEGAKDRLFKSSEDEGEGELGEPPVEPEPAAV